jgi:hypothetical protein
MPIPRITQMTAKIVNRDMEEEAIGRRDVKFARFSAARSRLIMSVR